MLEILKIDPVLGGCGTVTSGSSHHPPTTRQNPASEAGPSSLKILTLIFQARKLRPRDEH